MGQIYRNITEVIGNTPLVRLSKMDEAGSRVLGKMELLNPTGSVKDRIALSMIEDAEEAGMIKPGTIIIEPTSGNTGIGLAAVCAQRGYKLILAMPESMSIERRKLLTMFGAELILTPAEEGMKGAVDKATELVSVTSNSYMPGQFSNPANPLIHKMTTGVEILDDTDGNFDIFVAGVGTGGTFTGCSEVFKANNPNVKCIAVEPIDSPVLSGGNPGPHKIQGIGAGFVPDVMDCKFMDEVFEVTNDQAMQCARDLAKKEGILVGISAGANVYAALEIAKRPENKDKTVVTILCDTGERYISTELFK